LRGEAEPTLAATLDTNDDGHPRVSRPPHINKPSHEVFGHTSKLPIPVPRSPSFAQIRAAQQQSWHRRLHRGLCGPSS